MINNLEKYKNQISNNCFIQEHNLLGQVIIIKVDEHKTVIKITKSLVSF